MSDTSVNPGTHQLSEAEINITNGAVTLKGPIAVTVQEGGMIVGATFDPAASIWHVLILTP